MVMALDIDAVELFVLKSEREKPKEEQTIFELGVIDVVTFADLSSIDVAYNEQTKDNKLTVNILGRELEYVKHGLKGWKNFKDKDGKEVTPLFSTVSKGGRLTKVLREESLRLIPGKVIGELAKAIREICELSEDETKN
jgi:hypothetical protein